MLNKIRCAVAVAEMSAKQAIVDWKQEYCRDDLKTNEDTEVDEIAKMIAGKQAEYETQMTSDTTDKVEDTPPTPKVEEEGSTGTLKDDV